ncbi:ABC transporter ATP-binding protein [Paenibacillus contaminans]|uniref:Multidrug ABC transporter permease/ATP-binding protein n=1 Tax=Paenibacillus contaminans TaxID=450362 RepID=A0A329MJM7_9BACL|nr:ABC transporter transmembrane domain-containing protein [Paenibacillus contaminans]RAV20161.1 multidrug ABC transporter permease/ATP-binding protein [Paenibacillus contaminans]
MSFITKLQWFFKQQLMHYVAVIVLMVIISVTNSVPPKIIGDLIDQIKKGLLTEAILAQTVGLLIGLALLRYATSYFSITTLFGNSNLLETVLRGKLFVHLTRMAPSFYHRNRTGDLMALATNDIVAISQTAGYGVLTLANTLIGTTVVLVSMVAFTSWKLMLAALLPLPFLAYAINKLGKVMRTRFLGAQAAFGQMNDQALESISGMRVIRSYVQESSDAAAFDRVTREVMQRNKKVAVTNALFQPVVSTIVGMSYAISFGYGAYLVFHGDMTLGQLVSFTVYLGLLIWPMIAFGEFINVLQRGSASVDRLENALAQTADVAAPERPADVPVPTLIELKSLTFRYPGAPSDSLSAISLTVERGQTIGIVGRTGSGKSTLLKQLLRQYPIEPDRLFVAGVPIERITPEQVRSWSGYVPQEHLLLSRSIRDNIKLGKPEAAEEELQRATEMASFAQDVGQMAEGLATVVGEHGVMLSGGQKQRLSIARALLADPEMLILDDALSAVDARTESAILHNIRRERAGRTTWIATHRLSAVSHADWIVVLDRGRIVEEGTHEQLMMLGGWYKTQYERQQMEANLLQDGV